MLSYKRSICLGTLFFWTGTIKILSSLMVVLLLEYSAAKAHKIFDKFNYVLFHFPKYFNTDFFFGGGVLWIESMVWQALTLVTKNTSSPKKQNSDNIISLRYSKMWKCALYFASFISGFMTAVKVPEIPVYLPKFCSLYNNIKLSVTRSTTLG